MTSTLNPLANLSYYEFRTSVGAPAIGQYQYTSLFPSTKTVAAPLPTVATSFAFYLPMPTTAELRQHMQALKKHKIPLVDIYWFLPKGQVDGDGTHYNSTDIIRWMGGLYYDIETAVKKDSHVQCTLKSKEDPTFAKIVYLASTSLPQEAIDAIVVSVEPGVDARPPRLRPVLGRRAANPPSIVHFTDNGSTIAVRNKDGYILFGEQLLAEKKKELEQTYKKFITHGKPYMAISEQAASEALRATAEEGGFRFTGNARSFMLKKDDMPRRDIRYSTYTDEEGGPVFSYDRGSSSYSILLLVPLINKSDLKEPEDGGLYGECQIGDVVSELVVRTEFRVGGIYDPVFPSHVRQMLGALEAATEIVALEAAGKTVV